MKIVLLDSETQGKDLSFTGFNKYKDYIQYDKTASNEVVERIKDADIIVTCKVKLGKDELFAAKNLKYIALLATGYNNVDIEYCRDNGIVVTNVKGYSTNSVAQHIWALILSLSSNLNRYGKMINNGMWEQSEVFCLMDYPVLELTGKTIGIIGYGDIGQKVASIAKSFGMNVITLDRVKAGDIVKVDMDSLLGESDVISINTPLTDETTGLIGKSEFNKMKRNAILINCSRGGIVDEEALAEALKSGKIGGAGVDVLSVEPPSEGNVLLKMKFTNLIITPHIAWSSLTARQDLLKITIENIDKFIDGDLKYNLAE